MDLVEQISELKESGFSNQEIYEIMVAKTAHDSLPKEMQFESAKKAKELLGLTSWQMALIFGVWIK